MNNINQTKTEGAVHLAAIGEVKNDITKKRFLRQTNPIYKDPIKLQVTKVIFDKTSYEAFTVSSKYQNSNVDIRYNDSLKIKSVFLDIRVQDKIALLSNINSDNNHSLVEYLKLNEEESIISNISIALNPTDLEAVLNADEVFLTKSGLKDYAISLYNNSKLTKTIRFNQGVIFSYKSSHFCWKQNENYQSRIVDIVPSGTQCPRKTFRSAKRANKKVDYFKF